MNEDDDSDVPDGVDDIEAEHTQASKRSKKTKKEKKGKKKRKKVEDEEEEEKVNDVDGERNVGGDDEGLQEEKSSKRRKRKRKRKKKEGAEDGESDAAAAVDDSANDDAGEGGHLDGTTEEDRISSQVERTVFVEGIPFDCTDDDVRGFFAGNDCGDVEELRLPRWNDTGRLRGYGHVVFTTTSQRQRALQLSGKYLGNRYLSIQMPHAPRASSKAPFGGSVVDKGGGTGPGGIRDRSKTVLLHNLAYDATEDDIEAVMKRHGSIVPGGVRVVRHSQTHRSKGFAYVEYQKEESAVNVVEGRQRSAQSSHQQPPPPPIVVLNRRCRVDYDHGRIRGSFRTADGRLWNKEFGGNTPSEK